jgi:hypothetical protein
MRGEEKMAKLTIADIVNALHPEELRAGRIKLQDDGEGPYIKEWDQSVPKINFKDKTLKKRVKAIIKEREARTKRAAEYPAIGDQLDAILKQIKASNAEIVPELADIISRWEEVKRKHPKE